VCWCFSVWPPLVLFIWFRHTKGFWCLYVWRRHHGVQGTTYSSFFRLSYRPQLFLFAIFPSQSVSVFFVVIWTKSSHTIATENDREWNDCISIQSDAVCPSVSRLLDWLFGVMFFLPLPSIARSRPRCRLLSLKPPFSIYVYVVRVEERRCAGAMRWTKEIRCIV
jgi:hypothetical protein